MLKSEMNKLYRKLITLAILLGCLGLLVSSSRTTQVRAECGDDLCIQQFDRCREFYCNRAGLPALYRSIHGLQTWLSDAGRDTR